MLVCPRDGSTSFNYATVTGSALYKMAQAEAGLAETAWTTATVDQIQMQEKNDIRINKMRRKAAHRKRCQAHYSNERKRQQAGQRIDYKNNRAVAENMDAVWGLVSYKCTLDSRLDSWRKSKEDECRRSMARVALSN